MHVAHLKKFTTANNIIYFWLGILTGAMIILATLLFHTISDNGKTSLFRYTPTSRPLQQKGIINPEMKTSAKGITNPEMKVYSKH